MGSTFLRLVSLSCLLLLPFVIHPVHSGDSLSFFQITDLHVDFDYLPGSSPHCDLPLCCHYLNASDPDRAGPIGDYLCDATNPILTAAAAFIGSNRPDAILWTGDNPCHRMWKQTEDIVLEIVTRVRNILVSSAPSVPIIPVIDISIFYCFPVDQLYPPPKGNVYLNKLADIFAPLLSDEELVTFRKGGYYSRAFNDQLQFIVINTQWGDPLNFILYVNDTDPGGQLAWLSAELAAAERANKKVFMVGHIPMAPMTGQISPECLPGYCNRYLSLSQQYAHIIVGHTFGHVHTDWFRIIRDSENSPVGTMYISPALTTYQDLNPTIRKFVLDPASSAIIDVLTYYSPLDLDNAKNKSEWVLEYSMRDAYNLPDLSPASLDKLVHSMYSNRTLFDTFWMFRSNSFPKPSECGPSCVNMWLCRLAYANPEQFLPCFEHGFSSFSLEKGPILSSQF